MDILKAIKLLLMGSPKTMFILPFYVNNYKEVVQKWIDYKTKELIVALPEFKHVFRTFFEFHKVDKNHAMVFYSKGKDTAIVLGRIQGTYINIEIPVDDITHNSKNSFLATYSPV